MSTPSTSSNFTATYTYEPHRNLKTSVQNAFGVQVVSNYAYQYDPIGNRAQITEAANTGTFTANNLNQYTGQAVPGDGTRSFDYDADGYLISLIENGSEKVYTWNAENRLTSVAPRTPANGDKKVEFI